MTTIFGRVTTDVLPSLCSHTPLEAFMNLLRSGLLMRKTGIAVKL
jgi:hypothetical protein